MAMYPRDRTSSAGRVDHDPLTVFRRAFADNQNGTGMAFSVPTTTQPRTSTSGVHELEHGKKVVVLPYGTDATDEEIRLGIQLWFPLYDKSSTTKKSEDVVWIPTTAAILDCEMNSGSVAAGTVGPIVVGDMFCDIVALAANTTQPLVSAVDMVTDGGDVPTKTTGTAIIETIGAKYIQFFVDINGGAGTAGATGNALFAVI